MIETKLKILLKKHMLEEYDYSEQLFPCFFVYTIGSLSLFIFDFLCFFIIKKFWYKENIEFLVKCLYNMCLKSLECFKLIF